MELLLLGSSVHAFGQSWHRGEGHLVVVEIELLGDIGHCDAGELVVVDINVGKFFALQFHVACQLVILHIKPGQSLALGDIANRGQLVRGQIETLNGR